MLLEKERKLVVEYGKKLIDSGLTKGTGGNISIINREKGLFCISPSGIDYYKTEASDVVVMNLDGEIVDGDKKPSSEKEMHRQVYLNFNEANAVVHCHSVYATALSTLRENLPASNYQIAVAGGEDVVCAEYQTYGTKEIAMAAVKALEGRKACLLANHGLLTYGKDIQNAFSIARTIEECTMTYMIARTIGEPVILPTDEIDRMLVNFGHYGQ